MRVRRIARPMLASTFIYGGIDALRHPEAKASRAEKLDIPSKPGMDKLNITTSEQAVRVNAAVQVAGGVLLTLNTFPRLASLALAGSLVPTTAAGHRFWEESDPDQRIFHTTHFVKNLSILGGLLIASVDTAGKESLAHETQRVCKRSKRKAHKSAVKAAAKQAQEAAKHAGKKAGKKAEKVGKKAGKAQSDVAGKLHDLLPV